MGRVALAVAGRLLIAGRLPARAPRSRDEVRTRGRAGQPPAEHQPPAAAESEAVSVG